MSAGRLYGSSLRRMEALHGAFHSAWPVLRHVAGAYRRLCLGSTTIVAVVGSVGKSTTARAVQTALGEGTAGLASRNSSSFIARSVLGISPRQPRAVVEVGISRPGQMEAYASVLRPDVVVVTKIASDHHTSLGSLEVTRDEKAHMVRFLPASGLAVVNGDDPHCRWIGGQTRARIVTFGLDEGNDLRATDLRFDWPRGMAFMARWKDHSLPVDTRLFGRTSVYPILAALAVVRAEGLPLDEAARALSLLEPMSGRLQPVALPSGAWLLRDDHKGTEESLHAALDALSQVPCRRRWVVMGEVTEPTGSLGPLYRALGRRIAEVAHRAVFVCRRRGLRPYASGARAGGMPGESFVHLGTDIATASRLLGEEIGPGDVVLITGRNDQRFARIALQLSGLPVACTVASCTTKATHCADCPELLAGGERRTPRR